MGASRDLGSSVTTEPVSDSWQKGKAQGAPSGTLGGAQPAGGQVQGGGAGPAGWPEPWESPGSPQGTPGKRASWPERLCWALVLELLSRAGLKIAGVQQGQQGRAWGAAGGSLGPAQPSMALAHPPSSRWPAGRGPADRLFFPCLTKYGQGARPEGATWPAACLGCLAGYIRTAKVRPAPDTRGAPRPPGPGVSPPCSPLPCLPAVGACIPGGPLLFQPDLYLALTPPGGQEGPPDTAQGREGLKVCGMQGRFSLTLRRPPLLRLSPPSLLPFSSPSPLSQDLPPREVCAGAGGLGEGQGCGEGCLVSSFSLPPPPPSATRRELRPPPPLHSRLAPGEGGWRCRGCSIVPGSRDPAPAAGDASPAGGLPVSPAPPVRPPPQTCRRPR